MDELEAADILEIIDGEGSIHTTSLAEYVEVHPLTVATYCDMLSTKGYVTQVEGGVYELTELGERKVTHGHTSDDPGAADSET